MIQTEVAVPNIATREEWLLARRALLAREKELTKQGDRVSAERRRLPMVKLEKDYLFDSPGGKKSLADLFEDRRQLVVYHFMFGPEWDEGCPGCTGFVDALGDLSMLNDRETTFALISRAPLAKIEAYKASKGWSIPWYSSFGSDFNYDFHVTFDESVAPIQFNYREKSETETPMKGESQGLSVFFRDGETVFHTYSTFCRGVEHLTDAYPLLDVTPYGRQEDWEDSPPGWPQKPTYG